MISGGGGDDYVVGEGGDDLLSGGEGDDRVEGGDGQDVLLGDAGADQLYGGAGDDLIEGGKGADFIDGGDGQDTASYAESEAGVIIDLELRDGLGRRRRGRPAREHRACDRLRASRPHPGSAATSTTSLSGGAGDDQLFGYGGDDVLDGGAGADYLVGGEAPTGRSMRASAKGVHVDLSRVSGLWRRRGGRHPDVRSRIDLIMAQLRRRRQRADPAGRQ